MEQPPHDIDAASPDSQRRSKLLLLALGLVILGLTAAWIALNLAHTDDMAPGLSKEFAVELEKDCRRRGLAKTPCRQAIGSAHRRCFAEARVDDDRTRSAGLLAYDEERYRQCLEPAIDALVEQAAEKK